MSEGRTGRWVVGLLVAGTALAMGACSAPVDTGSAASVKADEGQVHLDRCFADETGALQCTPVTYHPVTPLTCTPTPSPTLRQDICSLAPNGPLPAALNGFGCSPYAVQLEIGAPSSNNVTLWICKVPAPGTPMPTKVLGDYNANGTWAPEYVSTFVVGTDPQYPACTAATPQGTLCELASLDSSCLCDPAAGSLIVMSYYPYSCQVGFGKPSCSFPGSCHGMCGLIP
jgi:hypothetical protein